ADLGGARVGHVEVDREEVLLREEGQQAAVRAEYGSHVELARVLLRDDGRAVRKRAPLGLEQGPVLRLHRRVPLPGELFGGQARDPLQDLLRVRGAAYGSPQPTRADV